MTQEKRSSDKLPTPHWKAVETALADHQGKKREARRAFRREPAKSGPAAAAAESPVLFVTETFARRTAEVLETAAGGTPPPGVVYWFGFEHGERSSATTLIVPEEENRADAVLASAVANEEIFSAIVSASLVFLGEVRLAPFEEERPRGGHGRDVRFAGAFSIELPPSRPLEIEGWRVHRQVEGESRRIEAGELHHHLRLIPGFKDLRPGGKPPPRVVTPGIRHVLEV